MRPPSSLTAKHTLTKIRALSSLYHCRCTSACRYTHCRWHGHSHHCHYTSMPLLILPLALPLVTLLLPVSTPSLLIATIAHHYHCPHYHC